MTVRIAQDVGMDTVARYGERFGIYDDMPHLLSYSLGAGETTLYRMVTAYAELANGGLKVEPTLVDRVQDRYGKTIYRHDQRACEGCAADDIATAAQPLVHSNAERVMDAITAYQVTSMLQGAVARGTSASSVGKLGLNLAGKTGTTNEFVDAWFAGYQPNLVGIAWMGFDQPKSLGRNQTGSVVALPIWIGYMDKALKDIPEAPRTVPVGVVSVPVLGVLGEGKLAPEFFYQEAVPPPEVLQPIVPFAPPAPPDSGPPP
jgi:penicillin-binding protein 1A